MSPRRLGGLWWTYVVLAVLAIVAVLVMGLVQILREPEAPFEDRQLPTLSGGVS